LHAYFFLQLKAFEKCNRVQESLKCYRVARNEKTKEYLLVLESATGDDLRNYIRHTFIRSSWSSRVGNAGNFAENLKAIHETKYMHRDLHPGNILKSSRLTRITDFGRA
jgi:serine/threonine protein kinase